MFLQAYIKIEYLEKNDYYYNNFTVSNTAEYLLLTNDKNLKSLDNL